MTATDEGSRPSAEREAELEEAPIAYDMLLRLRDKEVDEFSSKANLFVVTQSALVAFSGQALFTRFPLESVGSLLMLVVFSILGLTLSFICHRIIVGASFWIEYYQTRLGLLESAKLGDILVFRSHPSTDNAAAVERVAATSLARDSGVKLRYQSTRTATLHLSLVFAVLWVAVLVLGLASWFLRDVG